MVSSHTDFGDILNRIIDDTIKGILGEGTTEIYSHMKYYGIKTDRLGEDTEALERAMTEMFKAGWRVFKRAILRALCRELNLSTDIFANHSFVKCIEIAEREFFAKNRASIGHIQVMNTGQTSKLKGDDSILKLSLPQVELGTIHKTCKVCEKTIDIADKNSEQLLAELCDECWELQNAVWESPSAEAYIPRETQYNHGDK